MNHAIDMFFNHQGMARRPHITVAEPLGPDGGVGGGAVLLPPLRTLGPEVVEAQPNADLAIAGDPAHTHAQAQISTHSLRSVKS